MRTCKIIRQDALVTCIDVASCIPYIAQHICVLSKPLNLVCDQISTDPILTWMRSVLIIKSIYKGSIVSYQELFYIAIGLTE